MRGILEPLDKIGRSVRICAQKVRVPRPMSEAGSRIAVTFGDARDEMAGNAGVLSEGAASEGRVSACHARTLSKIKVPKPAASGAEEQAGENAECEFGCPVHKKAARRDQT